MYRWLLPLATSGFVMAGFLKGAPALESLPFDLTLGLAVITAVGVADAVVRLGVPRHVHGVVAGFALLLPPALFAAGTEYGAEKVMKLFLFTFLAVLAPVVLIRSRKDAERHLLAWTAVSGIVVGTTLLNPVQSGDYTGAPVTAAGTDTIDLGLTGGIVLLVMIMGVLWKRVPWLIAVPAGGASVYTLLQSGSRGPLISVVLGVAVAILLVRVRPRARRSIAVVGLVTGGLILAFQAAPYYSRLRIVQLVFEGQIEGSASTRVRLFEESWNSIVQNPLGVGWGGYQEIVFLGYRYPHNLPLEVLNEAGVVLGGLFLVWVAVQVWRTRLAAVDFAGGTAFAILTLMLGAAAVTGDINENRTLFYALGIGVALYGLRSTRGPLAVRGVGGADAHGEVQRVTKDVAG